MANVLYKTEDDIQVITIPDPANPYQPPDPNWDEGSSGLGGDYPPQTPTRPDGNQDDSNDGNAYTYVPVYDGQGNYAGTVMCGYNGCTFYEKP